MPDFLMIPTEPFALVAARMDDPNFVEIGRLPGWSDNPVYSCFHDCICIFVVDSDTSEIIYADRFAGFNCRGGVFEGETYGIPEECPCHALEAQGHWNWLADLEQKEPA